MKKVISIFLAMIIATTSSIFAWATDDIQVIVDGDKVVFDQNPFIENGSTLVPLRAIFEALGAVVVWDSDTQTVSAHKGGDRVSIKIGDKKLNKNCDEIPLNTPAKIVKGRTFVPVRAISESFGGKVDWDNKTRTINIDSKQGDHVIWNRYIEGEVIDKDTNTFLAKIHVSYPEIKNENDSSIIKKINEKYKLDAKDFYDEEEKITRNLFHASPEDFISFVHNKFYDVKYDTKQYISIVETELSSMGGEKPLFDQTSMTYDLTTGVAVSAVDILGISDKELRKIVKQKFIEKINENPDVYFENAIEQLDYESFALNYYLEGEYIVFYLQEWTIAEYYDSVAIPISEIKNK